MFRKGQKQQNEEQDDGQNNFLRHKSKRTYRQSFCKHNQQMFIVVVFSLISCLTLGGIFVDAFSTSSSSILTKLSHDDSTTKIYSRFTNQINKPSTHLSLSRNNENENSKSASNNRIDQQQQNQPFLRRSANNFENNGKDDGYDGLGEYDPSEGISPEREVVVGDPQLKVKEKGRSVTSILRELAAIQQQGPQKYCILGTRHCSYLHQQIIELLAYALVLSGNHVYTSGAGGTHAATIRGALRAEREDLLTVIIPQSMSKQSKESQELLAKVSDVIAMPQNDEMGLDVASRICNSYLLSQTDQLISFAFHESNTVIEATKEAKKLDMLVTTLYLD